MAKSKKKSRVEELKPPVRHERFFDKQFPGVAFVKFKPRMDNDGKRFLCMTFTVRMSPAYVLSCDEVIQSGYEMVETREKQCPRVEIERVYRGFNVEFFATHQSERSTLRLECVNLGAIAIERSPDESMATLLHFSTEFPYRADAGHWAVDNWGAMFWLRFQPTNRDLFTDSSGAAGSGEGEARAAAAGSERPQFNPSLPSSQDLGAHEDDATQRRRNSGDPSQR